MVHKSLSGVETVKGAHKLFTTYANNCSKLFWENGRHKTTDGFVKMVSKKIGVGVVLVKQNAYLHTDIRPDRDGLIYTPFSRMLLNRVDRRVTKTLKPNEYHSLREKLRNLIYSFSKSDSLYVADELNQIFSDIWRDEKIEVYLFGRKDNHNVLHTIVSVLIASAGKLLGLDKELFDTDSYTINGYSFIQFRHIAIAQDFARLCVLPSKAKDQADLFQSLTYAETPLDPIIDYCSREGVITSVLIKKISDFVKDARIAKSDHQIISVQAYEHKTDFKIVAIYSVDVNGFGTNQNLSHKIELAREIRLEIKAILTDLIENNASKSISNSKTNEIKTFRVLTSYSNDGRLDFKISRTRLKLPM